MLSLLALGTVPGALLFVLFICRSHSFGRRMPKMKVWRLDMFEDYGTERIIWKVPPTETQSSADHRGKAFSLLALMKSHPLSVKFPPPVTALYDEILLNHSHALEYLERNGFIGRTNFIGRFFRRFGFCSSIFSFDSISEVKDYVKQFSPVMATINFHILPKINGDGVLFKMFGTFGFHHSILVYGVDKNFACPDGSRGAFRVRWHYDWQGTDGWIPINLAEELFVLDKTFGYKY